MESSVWEWGSGLGAEGPRGPRVETQRRGGVRERERDRQNDGEKSQRETLEEANAKKGGGGGGKKMKKDLEKGRWGSWAGEGTTDKAISPVMVIIC